MISNEADEIVEVKSRTYTDMVKAYGGPVIVIAVNVVMCCFMVSAVYSNNVLLQWANQPAEIQQEKFNRYAILVFSAATATAMFVFMRVLLLICGNLRAIKILHNTMLHKVLCAPINLYFDVTPIG